MRVIALGTGQPSVNRAQANIGWLVELGNGDKFMFDFDYCSQANFSTLATAYTDIRAYFPPTCTRITLEILASYG
jgi:ribonuclease Z